MVPRCDRGVEEYTHTAARALTVVALGKMLRRLEEQRTRRIGLFPVPILAVIAIGILGTTASWGNDDRASASSACSRSTAKQLIRENPYLHPFSPTYQAPGQVLCGQFLGKGGQALVVSFKAATCGGTFGWAAFRQRGAKWKLAWRYKNGQRGISASGSDIEETVNVLLPGDPRCLPTGGTKSRIWHWSGGRFTAGAWDYDMVNPEHFLSPDRRVWCLMNKTGSDFCGAANPGGGGPQSAAYFEDDGKVKLCHVEEASIRESCFVNWDVRSPVLDYGETSEVNGIRCTSAPDGITCVKLTAPGQGNGFRISKDGPVVLDAQGAAASLSTAPISDARLWGALNGKLICGLAAHVQGSPPKLLCASQSIPAPKHGSPEIGDPGFAYLESAGRPEPARLSQYSWEVENGWDPGNRPELKAGQRWSLDGLEVRCAVRKKAVRCINGSGHGFAVKPGSYRSF